MGLYHAATDNISVSSCDIPFSSRVLLLYLGSLREGADEAVPTASRRYEPPLRSLLENLPWAAMKLLLESGNYCVYDFYPQVKVRFVSREALAHLNEVGRSFLNINTPE